MNFIPAGNPSLDKSVAMLVGVCTGVLIACPQWAVVWMLFGAERIHPTEVVCYVIGCALLLRALGTDERLRKMLARRLLVR